MHIDIFMDKQIIGKQYPFFTLFTRKNIIFFRAEAARAASEKKLLQLLTELVQTERKYVLDLEEVRKTHIRKKWSDR